MILVQDATPDSILQLHDELSNKLPTVKGKWTFTFKIFRNNIYSIPPELAATATTAPGSKYLYTWSSSYLNDAIVTLIDKRASGVFSHIVEEESANKHVQFPIPNAQLHEGATTGLNDFFDYFLLQRMQSLWNLRQTIKGDGGKIYELENGGLVIRTSNVTLHGNFRGLLLQLEAKSSDLSVEPQQLFQQIIKRYNIPAGNICYDVIDTAQSDEVGDLALQYAQILNF